MKEKVEKITKGKVKKALTDIGEEAKNLLTGEARKTGKKIPMYPYHKGDTFKMPAKTK
jgi:5-deoxy-D-glucuronate isomerase